MALDRIEGTAYERFSLKNTPGRKASDRTTAQIRACRQPKDSQGNWSRIADLHPATRRRGDRVKRRAFIAALGGAANRNWQPVKRRAFIAGLGGAAAWPMVARGQQTSKLPTIGFLGAGTRSGWSDWLAAFVQRLRELSWIEGRTVAMEVRWAEGRPERYTEIAAEFVRLKVDVIVTVGSAVVAATQATSVIPIVFAAAVDPLGAGLVASLARPGGNVTGLSMQSTEMAGKRLEILREVLPNLRRLAVIGNGNYPAAVLEIGEVQAAGRTLGIEVDKFEIRGAEDIAPAFNALKSGSQALYLCADALLNAYQNRINILALGARLPTIYPSRNFLGSGGLISYGVNNADLFRRAADYVDKILRGAKPSDLPVEQPTKFELVFNLTTAKALGLEIPPALLARANELIE
jgi:putative ABC transport system substrate-binding protein